MDMSEMPLEHGQRLAAIVPADIATELASLSDEERAEFIEDMQDALAARHGLASIQAGEPVVAWEEVKARLEL